MRRSSLIAVLGAAVVGSTGGGLAALHLSPNAPREPSRKLAARVPAPAPHAAIPDAAIPEVTIPDVAKVAGATPAANPRSVLATQMTAVLTRFAAWSRDHAGAPCPALATLGLAARDPWGHDLTLTCTDQPADQMIGARSAGPDAVFGTDDDVTSWTLGPSVTSLVRGPRWKAASAAPTPSRRRKDPRGAERAAPSAPPPIAPSGAGHPRPPAHPTSPSGIPATTPARPPPLEPIGDDIPARRSSR
jgi:hypothetical protein